MSTGSSPPAQPPMMSPDGKWVWDGQKWIPVARHESVFPAYSAATAEPAAPLAETMVSPPINPFAPQSPASRFVGPPASSPFAGPTAPAPAVQSPAIVSPPSYTAGGATPPWQAWAQGTGDRGRMMKLGAAFIAIALLVILFIYVGLSQMPFLRANNNPAPSPQATGTPIPQLAARTDSAVAARYVDSIFTPTMAYLRQPMLAYGASCNGTFSFSCQQGFTNLNQAVTDALQRFSVTPPPCIAPQIGKLRSDLAVIQVGAGAGLKSYTDSDRTALHAAILKLNSGYNAFYADAPSVPKAAAACDNQPQGP